jgi:hypothetical protein
MSGWWRHWPNGWWVLCVVSALPGSASAHDGLDFHERQWVLKLGVPLAASLSPQHSFVSGVEANCGWLDDDGLWFGGYVDGHWSFSAEQARFSLGPMAGWGPFGIDGGYLLALDDRGLHQGIALRPFLTFGYAAFYHRWGVLFGDQPSVHDIGLLIELPIPLTRRSGAPPAQAPPVAPVSPGGSRTVLVPRPAGH